MKRTCFRKTKNTDENIKHEVPSNQLKTSYSRMKRVMFFMYFLCTISFIKAQAPCAVFYSELGEKFTVHIDGIVQHQYMESNVKVLDISGSSHNIKIAFENNRIQDVNKTINLANGTESTFVIYKKSDHYDMSSKKQISLSEATRSESSSNQAVVIYNDYKPATTTTTITTTTNNNNNSNSNISTNSNFDDDTNTGNANIGINMGIGADGGSVSLNVNVNDNTSGNKTGNNTTAHSTSTVSSSSNGGQVNNTASSTSNNTAGSVSISANISGNNNQTANSKTNSTSGGVKTNNNQSNNVTATKHNNPHISENLSGVEQSEIPIKQTVPAVAGYNGRIGCTNPMSSEAFTKAKESILAKNFSNAQLTIAKQIIDANCMIVSQVKEIMKIFDFEESRLEFAKYAHKKTYDLDNYYQVNDAFDFEGSVSKLDEFIRTGK